MQYLRICLCAMLVCLFSCFGTVLGQETIDLKSLADSVRKANGKPNFLPLGMRFLELAKERKDTANISEAYAILANHYYELGNTDSLRLVTYEYMEWADRCHRNTDRFFLHTLFRHSLNVLPPCLIAISVTMATVKCV